MSMRSLRLAGVVALALAVALGVGGCVRGSGNVVTEDRPIDDVERVELSGIGRLEITQGDTTELTVEADDNLMQYIKTESSGGRLVISQKSGTFPFITVDPTATVIYHLTVPSLSRVELSGSGEIIADGFEADELEVDISGSGVLELRDLVADRFAYDLSGSGRALVTGTAAEQDIVISGSGRLDAGDLESEEASLDINGSGRAIVWASRRLSVDISGSGEVQYYGSPDVDQKVSGSGRLDSLGEKN